QSPGVRGSARLTSFVPETGRVVVRTVRHPPIRGGATYRVAATRAGGAVVYAAASVEPVTDSINTLEALLAAAVPTLVLLVGATTWWLVGRTLAPVEAMRRQVSEISAAELGRRVPEPGTGDEV